MKQFKILHRDGNARVGRLVTPHGIIETPNFNPVGTQAPVKSLGPRELKEIGVQMVLANTYHLMLRPGADLIEKFDLRFHSGHGERNTSFAVFIIIGFFLSSPRRRGSS